MEHVVCGSIAIDRILLLDTTFDRHILPTELSRLSVSFAVPTEQESWGGTGANIAYALAQLGEHPALVGAIGAADEDRLRDRWDGCRIDHRQVVAIPDIHTARATILTDLQHNQITGFHPGALPYGLNTDVLAAGHDRLLTIVAPDDPKVMAHHMEQLIRAQRPFLFDPGQAVELLSPELVAQARESARGVLVNDYEMSLLHRKTGDTPESLGQALGARGGALVVTKGAAGCEIWDSQGKTEVPAGRAKQVVDPTGCGDAFRAGLMYGLARQWPWANSARMGAAVAAIQVAHSGTQTYTLSPAWVAQQTHQWRPSPTELPARRGRRP
jgi:adenosine kinase